jgi:sugar phosphate isomerase/epimerase
MSGLGLAVQLYTLRERLAEDLEGTLEALAQAGAREVELAGLYERDASEMRRILDVAGLSACSMHQRLERFEDEFDQVLEEANTLGVETLILPWVPAPENASAADELVARIVAAGEKTRAAGWPFGYHNHAFEFGEVDLWSRLVATELDLELDVGWLRIAGLDPVTTLQQLTGRVLLVHAKDVTQTGDGWIDVVAGDGELDFKAIARAAEAAGASRLIVELDTPSDDPVEDSRRSLETLQAAL